MLKKVTLSSEEKRFQTALLQERELQKLVKEYFVLEKVSTFSRQVKGNALAKKEKVIQLFQDEKKDVSRNLLRATAPGRIKEEHEDFEKLSSVLDSITLFKEKVAAYKKFIFEIDDQCRIVKKDVLFLKHQQVTDKQMEERVWKAIKTLETLENSLELQMHKFGIICRTNSLLREKIDFLMWDRENFMYHWRNLIKKLSEGKQIMLDLIEQATIAYNQREDWCQRLNLLRMKAAQEYSQNIDLLRENKRRTYAGEKLKEFLMVKGQKRLMHDLERQEKEKREKFEENVRKQLDYYGLMFNSIESFTKEHKVGKIAEGFVKQELYNLSLFQYIINAIKDMENMGDELGLLHLQIDSTKCLHNERNFNQDQTVIDLTSKLEATTREAAKADEDLKQTNLVFDEILSGINELFTICHCDSDKFLELLADNKGIQYYNVNLYLESIEVAVNNFLIRGGYKDSQRKSGDSKRIVHPEPEIRRIFGVDDIVVTHPCILCVERELITGVVDKVTIPFTRAKAAEELEIRSHLPSAAAIMHNVSKCQLPQARSIMQHRYV